MKSSTDNCCIKPLAGKDATVCLPTNTLDLIDAKSNEMWVAFDPTASPVVNASTGLVSNLVTAGTYKFILQNTLGTAVCSDTIAITVAPTPVSSAIAKPTTCVNSVMQANGQIELDNFNPGERYAYSLGSFYSGSLTYATATAIPSSRIIVNNLPNPAAASQDYTIRIFNAAGCYKDITVQLIKSTASCCVKPVAGTDLTICLASSTTVDLTDAKSDETWVAFDPAVGPTINASTLCPLTPI